MVAVGANGTVSAAEVVRLVGKRTDSSGDAELIGLISNDALSGDICCRLS